MLNPGNVVKERTCPICGKKLRGKQAMRSHLLSHATTPAATRVVVRGPAKRKRKARKRNGGAGASSGTVRTESGSDVIAVVSLIAPGAVGQRLAEIQLNPRLLTDTRLHQVSTLWSRWRPTRLVFSVAPSAGTFVTGSYIAGWTPDPTEKVGSGVSAVRQIATFKPSVERHVSAPMMLNVPCDASRKWYDLAEGDESGLDSDHGSFVAVQAAAIGNLTGSVSFSIHLDWTIQFDGPDMPTITAGGGTVYADSAYTPYFTDSSSDWQQGVALTLKAKEGGFIVDFPDLKPDMLYKLDDKANLYYWKDSSSKELIRYGVRAKDYVGYPIMAVFAEKSYAEAYLTKGSASYLTKYVAAGPWVTPNNPAWTEESKISASLFSNRPVPGKQIAGSSQIEALQSKVDELSEMMAKLLAREALVACESGNE